MTFFHRLRAALCGVGGLLAGLGTLQARTFTVMAFNVENLVDADGRATFEEYRAPHFSRAHTLTKLQNVARVLAKFDDGRGPDIILFAELEADLTPAAQRMDYDAVLQRFAAQKLEAMLGDGFTDEVADLPAEALLAKACADRGLTGYHIVVADNVPDRVDAHPMAQNCVVFSRFPVVATRSHPTASARAILEVQVEVDGARLYLFDNHWKSGASDPAMERVRVKNARTLRARLDEIFSSDPHADIIIGGDFNSEYDQSSRHGKIMAKTGLNDVLGSQGDEVAVRGPRRDLYNLWYDVPVAERGSDRFQGEWGTLIQLIISRGLFDFAGVQYVDGSFSTVKFAGLNVDGAGLPVRWSSEGAAGSGVSDHLPVCARFVTVGQGNADRYLPVKPKLPEPVAPADADLHENLAKRLETSVDATALPVGVDLRTAEFTGKIIRVVGVVGPGKRLTVEFRGEVYDVWSFDARIRNRLRAAHQAGDGIRFYGELGRYKGRWQFVVSDESWIK